MNEYRCPCVGPCPRCGWVDDDPRLGSLFSGIAEALSATTAGEVGGEPVVDVYRPGGLAVLAVAAILDSIRAEVDE